MHVLGPSSFGRMSCAIGIAVADAHPSVRAAADWSTALPGGRGAVREVCDMLVASRSIEGKDAD